MTEENVHVVCNNLQSKFTVFINNLCTYFKPHVQEWSTRRRQLRAFARDIESFLYASVGGVSMAPPTYMRDMGADSSAESLMQKGASTKATQDTSCGGYVQPEWALIAMLRTGLIGVQMLVPENAQSHLVIATDGCCAIPNESALEQLTAQLRARTIQCSFIQTATSSGRGAALGMLMTRLRLLI